MEHIKFASALGTAAAFNKYALENPEEDKKKGGMPAKYKAMLALLAGGGLAGGGALAANQAGMLGNKMNLGSLFGMGGGGGAGGAGAGSAGGPRVLQDPTGMTSAVLDAKKGPFGQDFGGESSEQELPELPQMGQSPTMPIDL
jgi:hypothetical protein